MNRNNLSALRMAARGLLWMGGMVWGIGLVDGAVPAMTVAFLSTIIALLTLQHLDRQPTAPEADW
jgi:hypothetical protein